MPFKSVFVYLGKVLVCGAIFYVGMIGGAMLGGFMGLTAVVPAGIDANSAGRAQALVAPLVGLAVALLASGMGGGHLLRGLALALFTYIVYGVNTVLEGTIILPSLGSWGLLLVMYLVASVGVSIAAVVLFPAERLVDWRAAVVHFWQARLHGAWLWRLPLAAVVFMPVYYFFGLLVIQVTGPYYQQNIGGLTAPTLEQLLPILFVRSVLFLLACLPILVLWRHSEWSLILRLGASLFILVGFAMLLVADWLPPVVRIAHSLEILADEFVYAWLLVKLLGPSDVIVEEHKTLRPRMAGHV